MFEFDRGELATGQSCSCIIQRHASPVYPLPDRRVTHFGSWGSPALARSTRTVCPKRPTQPVCWRKINTERIATNDYELGPVQPLPICTQSRQVPGLQKRRLHARLCRRGAPHSAPRTADMQYVEAVSILATYLAVRTAGMVFWSWWSAHTYSPYVLLHCCFSCLLA